MEPPASSEANGIGIHYVRHGGGFPLVLLHGWPEFWYTWRKNIPVLAGEFDVVAPDLRGFGDTDKPGLPDPPKDLLGDFVEDLRALADALGFERFGVVSHDVGAYVAQGFARKYPERLGGLFFFDCPYPGIGRRWADRRIASMRSGTRPSTSSRGLPPWWARTGRRAKHTSDTFSTTGRTRRASSTRTSTSGWRTS